MTYELPLTIDTRFGPAGTMMKIVGEHRFGGRVLEFERVDGKPFPNGKTRATLIGAFFGLPNEGPSEPRPAHFYRVHPGRPGIWIGGE